MALPPQLVCFVVEYTKDFNRLRAARASGVHPQDLDAILDREDILNGIAAAVQRRNEITQLDSDWVMTELADNHIIAKQTGNLGASNKALELIGKLARVDAFAAQRVDLTVSDDIVERLSRGRQRAAERRVIDVEAAPAAMHRDRTTTTALPELPYAVPTPSFV